MHLLLSVSVAFPAAQKTAERIETRFMERTYSWIRRISPWLLGLYWIVLFTLTHVPVPEGLPGSDLALHLAAYFVLSCMFTTVLLTRGVRGRRLVLTTFGVLFAFGVFDELTQTLVNRHCDPRDMAADCVGVVCGLAVAWFLGFQLFGTQLSRAHEGD